MASVKNVNTNYTLNVGPALANGFPNGNGIFTINAQTVFKGNVTYEVPATTVSPFITVAANNTGSITDMGLLAQIAPNTFAGFRFDTSANTWQISSSVNADGSPITAYSNITGATASGPNNAIQINNNGIFAGSGNLIFDPSTNLLSLTGNEIVSGNVTANYFIGNGSKLTQISGSNIQGTVANAYYADIANIAYVANTADTAYTAAYVTAANQSNIRTVGILSNLTVSGNIVGFGTLSIAGAVNLASSANIASANIAGNLSIGGNINSDIITTGNISAAGEISAAGNITGNYFFGNGSQLTGVAATTSTAITNGNTIVRAYLDGNVTANISGISNVIVWAPDGEYVTGNINLSNNISAGGNILATGNLVAEASITALGNIVANGNILAQGNITAVGNLVAETNVTAQGNVVAYGNLVAQQNITALGNIIAYGNTLTEGDITALGNILTLSNFSAAGNLTISKDSSLVGNTYIGTNLSIGGTVVSNISTTGQISAVGNITVNPGSYFIGNGSQLTGVAATTATAITNGNTQVYAYLNGNVTANITAHSSNIVLSNFQVSNTSGLCTFDNSPGINPTIYVNDHITISGINTGPGNITGYDNYTATVTGVFSDGTNVTLTVSNLSGPAFPVGGRIEVAGVTPGDYNGDFTTTGSTANTVTYISSTPATGFSIISASGTGATATLTFATQTTPPFSIGSTINVSGVTPSDFNGSYVVTGCTTNSVSYASNLIINGTGGFVNGTLGSSGLVTGITVYDYYVIDSSGSGFVLSETLGGAPVTSTTGLMTGITATVIYSTVDNVIVWSPTGEYVKGEISATGNLTADGSLVIGGNISGGGSLSVPGDISGGGNLYVPGNITAPGADTQIVYNNNGNLAAGTGLTFDYTTGAFSAAGNISSGGYLFGNGSQLTGVAAQTATAITNGNTQVYAYLDGNVTANISGVPNVIVWAPDGEYITGNLSVSGEIYGNGNLIINNISSGGNITSVGNIITQASISASGNIVANGNILAQGNITAAGNVVAEADVTAQGNVHAIANIYVGANAYITQNAYITGDLVVTGNTKSPGLNTQILYNDTGNIAGNSAFTFNPISNVLFVNGNITANTGSYFIGNGSQLTGVAATTATAITNGNTQVYAALNGNVHANINDVANVIVWAPDGEYVTGNINASNNISAGGNITSQGNLSSYNITAGGKFTGDGSGITNIQGSQVVGPVLEASAAQTANYAGSAGTAGTVTDAAQGNITSLGVLDYLSVIGNITTQSYFIGNFIGNVSANIKSPGSNTQVIFNNSGLLGASPGFTFDQSSNILSVAGNIVGNGLYINKDATILGNLDVQGNVTFIDSNVVVTDDLYVVLANNQTSYNNIDGAGLEVGNAGTGSLTNWTYSTVANAWTTNVGISATANVTGGNIATSGVISASGNIQTTGNLTGGNIATSGVISALGNIQTTGNLTGGNIATSGTVSALGDVLTNGNVSAVGFVCAVGNVVGGNLITDGALSVAGNVTGGNVITSGTVSATGNITGGNLAASGTISALGDIQTTGNLTAAGFVCAVGNIVGGNLAASGTISAFGDLQTSGNVSAIGFVCAVGNVVGGNLITSGNISASGNIAGNYFFGNGSQLTGIITTVSNVINGNSNVNIDSANANVTISVSTIGNVAVFSPSGVSILGNISSNGNITSGGDISAVGNIVGNGLFINNDATILGNLNVQGNITFIDSNVIVTNDLYVQLANNQSTYANINGAGLQVGPNSAPLTNWTYNYPANSWTTNVGISASGNIAGNYFFGNGSQLTGIAVTDNITFSNTTISTSILNANIYLAPTGSGVVVIANTSGGATGIQLGSNTAGQFISNAVTLTSNTSVTNGIAELNQVLGKLVPPQPPTFGANTPISITSATTAARMCSSFTQPNNTTTGNKAVPAGTLVNVLRSSTYSTNSIANVGPGDNGTLTVLLNSNNAGTVNFNPEASPTANGVYSNLVITNNEDYHYANANIIYGFWYVFTSQATGSAPSGWNEIYLSDSVTSNTNTVGWYYDSATVAAPVFSSTTIAPSTTSLTYSSTIPHYNSGTVFSLAFNVNNLSGNMYPNNGNLLTNSTTAGGAFTAPATVSYSAAGITVPLTQNLYVGSGNASASTTANIISGFGSSNSGPNIVVTNSYASSTHTFSPANTVLYKTGTGTAIDESNIVIGSTIGSGSGNAYRIVNPGSGNTPVFTGSEAQFNSQTGPFYSYDATVVGSGTQGILKFDKTNYASGAYLPVGPNLTAQGSDQYFTFKFIRSSTSKFDIAITGTVAGVWVALPGSIFDTTQGSLGPTSGLNGWLTMSLPYGGAGAPGSNSANGGNGSDGCSLGSSIPLNTPISGSYTCTFGTVSSTNTATNEIYVRIRLTAGQSVTALSLQTASN